MDIERHEYDSQELFDLLSAVHCGDHATIRQLVKSVNIDQESVSFGGTSLNTAVRNSDVTTVRLLLELGASPNTYIASTPLVSAAIRGDVEMIRILLRAGADVNLGNESSDESPLMYAAQNARLAAADLLVDAGADINHLSIFETNALDAAYSYEWRRKKRNPVVDFLIDCGAVFTQKKWKTWTRPNP